MSIVSDPKTARKVISRCRDKRISVPCFCAENTYTMEGILLGAKDFGKSLGIDEAVVYIAATGNYHGRQQLKNYTTLNDTYEGYLAFKSDLERLARSGGVFGEVTVIPSLDHGQPGDDDFLFEEGKDFWGCVMYDCSTRGIDENMQMTADFVKKYRNDFLIEGCVDEIIESGEGGIKLTEPETAKTFLEKTGVDLMVVNAGTEHRATAAEICYRGDIVRDIYALVGHRLVLHGTSSLSSDDLCNLAEDGIAKVNIWTVLETKTAASLAKAMFENTGRILPDQAAEDLYANGFLGEKGLKDAREYKQELRYLTELWRRNDVKVPTVQKLVKGFMERLIKIS